MRKEKLQQRNKLSEQSRILYSKQLCDRLTQWELCQLAKKIYVYAPLGNEVDIWPFIEWAYGQGKALAFPRVEGTKLRFYQVADVKSLKEGAFHVLEPDPDIHKMVDWEHPFVLTPGVVFDRLGGRMGYGKGFYDGFLAEHQDAIAVGISYEMQLVDEIATHPGDQAMDYVVTEQEIYQRSYSYEEAVALISNSRRFGKLPGVEVTKHVMEELGNPQEALGFVHIAGTNGKGSTAAFLHQICLEAGIEAGLFTSPHLVDFTERIRMGKEQIDRKRVAELVTKLVNVNHRLLLEKQISMTMFDYCFAMAMIYYKENNCPLVILETGLGGRLDATNVIPAPAVSVITGIGLEHSEYLGNTVAAIAGEKAGILKKGSKAVFLDQSDEALQVLCQQADALGLDYVIAEEQPWESIGMSGAYQRQNASTAAKAAEALSEFGYSITPEHIRAGIAHAYWPGRFERVWDKPELWVDGAHNGHGVEGLKRSIQEMFFDDTSDADKKCIFAMAVMADKDYPKMIAELLPFAKKFYTVNVDSSRGLQSEVLRSYIQEQGVEAEAMESVAQLLQKLSTEDATERIVVFGSLYFIGEIKSQIK